MKKLIGAVLVSMMAISMTACGSKNEVGQASPPVQTPQAAAQTESHAEPASQVEDGQNPVMNFIGPYKAGDMEMLVEANGTDQAKITVNLRNGDESIRSWFMSGTFDPDTCKVEYTDGEKIETPFAEDGSVSEEIVVYKDGTGRVMFNAQDGTIIWEDDKEHTADDYVFEFNFPMYDESDESGLAD